MASQREGSFRRLLRLLAYARPYAWVVVVAVVFSFLYAGGLTGRIYLVKPLLDDVVVPDLNAKALSDVLSGNLLTHTDRLSR